MQCHFYQQSDMKRRKKILSVNENTTSTGFFEEDSSSWDFYYLRCSCFMPSQTFRCHAVSSVTHVIGGNLNMATKVLRFLYDK